MFIIRSLQASALFLSFSTLTEGWSLGRKHDQHAQQHENPIYPAYQPRGASYNGVPEKRQDQLMCPNDQWQAFLDSVPKNGVTVFCNDYLGIPPATTVVEYTPTVTVTTSANSTTATTITSRVVTTSTVVETATTTIIPRRRAANLFVVGEELFSAVVANGTSVTPASASTFPTSSKNTQQIQAESALANACSCKMVDPTATVTESYAVPAVTSTVGFRILSIITLTDIRVFTARTTVIKTSSTSGGNAKLVFIKPFNNMQIAKSNSSLSSTISSSAASSGIGADATSVSPNGQTSISAGLESSDAITPMSIATSSSTPITSAPASSAPTVTALPFSCPEDDGKHIDQIVDGVRLNYIVMCNTQLQTEERVGPPVTVDSEATCAAQCSLLNAQTGQDTCQAASFEAYTDGRSGGTCTISRSSPGYVESPGSITVVHTGTYSNGDQCRNFNSTSNSSQSIDASALYASITSAGVSVSIAGLVTQTADGGVYMTSFSTESTDASGYIHWRWYVVSASSSYWRAVWATTWECTALVTRTIVSQPIASVEVTTTTIINGATTTLIWGTTTSVFTNGGGGVSPPTFVPAVTTDSNGDVTTLFSLAAQTGTGGEGIVSPTGTPAAGNLTVSGSTFTFSSTGDAGVLPPVPTPSAVVDTIVSSGNAQYTISGSIYTSNSDGGEGIIPPPSATNSSGSENITISGGTYTAVSTGLDGIITPVITATGDSSISTSPPAIVTSIGSLEITISGSTATLQSTGGEGVFPPVPSANISQGISVAVTSGEASFATGSSTLTSYSNGDSGINPPDSTSSIPFAGNQTTVTPSPTGRSFNVTVSGSTTFASSTGDSGVLPPPLLNESSIISAAPAPSLEIEISIGVGTVEISTSSSTATTLSTGDNGIIPPAPTNISTSSFQSLGLISSVNVTSTGGMGNISTQVSTAITFSTGGEGILPPLSSPTSTLNFNSSSETPFTNSERPRTGDYSDSTSTTSSTGVPLFTSNLTMSVSTTTNLVMPSSIGSQFSDTDTPRTSFFDSSTSIVNSTTPSASPTPSSNASSTGPPFTNSGSDRTPFFNETTSMPSSTLSPASITTSRSFNVSLNSTGPPFTYSEADRTPDVFSSTLLNATIPATSPTDSALVSTPTVNASMSSSFIAIVTTTVSVFISPFANVTSSVPSSGVLTGVTPSANSTLAPTDTPVVSSGTLLPPNNTTTSSSSVETPVVPPIFGNSTVPLGSGSGFSSSTVPSATPSAPFNSTDVPPFPTGNSSIPLPTPTGFVNNSTTLDICPTAPIVVTVTTVQTSVEVQISTLTETVTAGAVSTTSASPASTPADLHTEDRRAGQIATQPQIEAACANPDNVVTNPSFSMSSDNTVSPWTVDNLDPTITVGSEQDPNSNGTIAQFKSAVVGRTLTITQPLTLCPGQQYELSSMNRQANTMAGCTARYRIGNHTVYTVTPQTTWLERSEYFTAGLGADGASVDLQITASCSGYAGMPVTDQAGWMRVEISAVSVVLYDVDGSRSKKRAVSVVEMEPVEYAALMWS
ncbi:hypothetical protein P3342_012256 [Pyrenophora teres f. teres]|nr:hypothetical protein P3342_012256 [Pyrenophora teres f. teres]